MDLEQPFPPRCSCSFYRKTSGHHQPFGGTLPMMQDQDLNVELEGLTLCVFDSCLNFSRSAQRDSGNKARSYKGCPNVLSNWVLLTIVHCLYLPIFATLQAKVFPCLFHAFFLQKRSLRGLGCDGYLRLFPGASILQLPWQKRPTFSGNCKFFNITKRLPTREVPPLHKSPHTLELCLGQIPHPNGT